ncbi:hypothetical protein INR49_002308 [Caranx melampygus]|nr:hypothetical protein INR49_002308 [Caranx melampygus]
MCLLFMRSTKRFMESPPRIWAHIDITLHPQSKSSRTHTSRTWASAVRQKLEVGVRNSHPLELDRFKRSDRERSDHTGTSMLLVHILRCGLLMLCWTQHSSHGLQLKPDHDAMITGGHHTMSSTEHLEMKKAEHTIPPTKPSPASTVSHHTPHSAPCFVEDIFVALRECVGSDGELTSGSLTLFGICTATDSSPVLVAEEEDRETLTLTLHLPASPLLGLSPVLLLALDSPFRGGDLDVTFTSQSLQPNTQSACISGETQYILLTGEASESTIHQKWRISVETNNPEMKQSLKDLLIGGKSRSKIGISLLLLFSTRTGTDTSSSVASSETFSFLCELKHFLGDVLPHNQPRSPPLPLDSLSSLPPLSLDLSSSESLLAGLINSSFTTVFSFPRWGSISQVHPGQLAMSPALVEEVRQRLEQIGTQVNKVIREKEVGVKATERLERLKELSALPTKEQATGQSQFCAFLLLKALQTVAREYELQTRLRATRADSSNPVRASVCSLTSLTVSLERRLMGPNTANINNCRGSCAFPLTNANNHAVLLHFHIESGNVDERAPCCVPLAYEPLEVVDLNEHGTTLSIKPDMVAKECGCR